MKILWFSWKDLEHPLAGGAEVVNTQLAKRLVKDGHEVTFIVGGFEGGAAEVTHPDGYKIIRLGGRVTIYWMAYRYYKKHLKGWADLVIDEVNTVPFFCKLYVREPNIIFCHMLCRVIWFFQLREPLSSIGYFTEPLYLKLLKDRTVITVSESTKQDMITAGFKAENIHIISEGYDIAPAEVLQHKDDQSPMILSLGAIRPMKRILDQVKAYEIAKQELITLRLIIAGDDSGKYAEKVKKYVQASPHAKDIQLMGKVSQEEKKNLLRRAYCVMVTSVKEGWGLTVTEANSQGTSAIVYNVDGLRDSVKHNQTGLITEQNNPQHLADSIVKLLTNHPLYDHTRMAAWKWSKTITFDKSYDQFKEIIGA